MMAELIFSDVWARSWGERLATSDAYRTAADKWEGDIVMVLEPDAKMGIEKQSVYLVKNVLYQKNTYKI